MKVVVSGSTGYIGGAILTQCLNHPSINSVLVLTRRDPGDVARHPKARLIVVKDFISYDASTVDELRSADAAIWCLGTFNGDTKVDIEYPLAFISAIKSRHPSSAPFRYVQLGGALTEPPSQEGEKERSLWFYANGRRVRGATEAKIMEASADDFEVHIVKPGAVLRGDGGLLRKCVLGDSWAIGMDDLAATMVNLAVRGHERRVFSNQDIIKHATGLQADQVSIK